LQAGLVEKALEEHKKILIVASQSKKPSDSDFQKIVAGQVAAAGKVGELKDKARKTKFPNHLATIAEGLGALNWVAVVRSRTFLSFLFCLKLCSSLGPYSCSLHW